MNKAICLLAASAQLLSGCSAFQPPIEGNQRVNEIDQAASLLERASFDNGKMHGGNQAAAISLIHRRSSRLVPHRPGATC